MTAFDTTIIITVAIAMVLGTWALLGLLFETVRETDRRER